MGKGNNIPLIKDNLFNIILSKIFMATKNVTEHCYRNLNIKEGKHRHLFFHNNSTLVLIIIQL